jgi:hypothetical protein
MKDLLATDDEVVRDDPTMAPPPDVSKPGSE